MAGAAGALALPSEPQSDRFPVTFDPRRGVLVAVAADGATDDTAAIQAALDHAGANMVLLPVSYRVTIGEAATRELLRRPVAPSFKL
jgi:hypothetical protein